MIPYKFKLFALSILSPLLLGAITSCNQGDSEEGESSNGVADLFKKKELPQATTDSLFVQKYIAQEPEFKEHEALMYKFYGDRNYELAWFKENELVPQANKFLNVIDSSSVEGLNPDRYKLVKFNDMFQKYEQMDPQDSARLDLQQQIDIALTASYFNYASDFYRGRVDPTTQKNVNWSVKKNKIKLHKALQTILQERESTYPYYEFDALHAGYTRLRDALQEYRRIQEKGGWPKVELGGKKTLQKGDSAQAVATIRKRLNPNQPIDVNDKRQWYFDEKLDKQVRQFQMLHGLKEDGVVGGNTLATMNVPLEDRIEQIMINMERWRWIPKRMVPKSLDQKYIWVNIPEYKLYIYEDPNNDPEAERAYEEVMSMRVVVGKTMNATPIFSEKMEYVVLAPYWNVPNSIVEKEIKPHMLTNPGWLDTQNMEIVTKEKNPKPISPSSIDWENVTEKNFQYMVRQKPGPKNSLGQLKFLFPNQHAIYLHDTPADALFSQTERNFSHGCVRLEKPVELAKYILQDMPEWDESRIRETMNGGEEKWVTLPKKMQVYLVYFTSWVDDQGNVHFREDLYGHDKKLKQEYFG
ncbi:L,D-transpeptidase family protein [Pontibacter anaerobius]|uniref:L,D-transpeptidase family protein n=1 Tax=Pontibacter anaerobius TaxID=2993940 RepID=A0ABT3RD32_9BACT|nr:L,D-transpeptidase family protein [Pontibacter anaerobius]MCX2739333.1 L,D-transpeptidase family protein [Pontibacter anaerobius]